MKTRLRQASWVMLMMTALAGCASPSTTTTSALLPAAVVVPSPVGWPKSVGGAIVRLVDGTGSPVPGVMVMVHAESEPGRSAGISDEKGEVVLPVQPDAIYQFIKNRRTLLAQTTQNLFSLGPSAPHYYRYDGKTVIVPLPFAPTTSPQISPVVDPLQGSTPAPAPIRVGQ